MSRQLQEGANGEKPRRRLYESGDLYRISEPPTKEKDGRHPFRRDLARLIHCSGFRRLQGKMQLFPSDESDFFRNRLTHSMEVAQIASGIATNLNAEHAYFRRNKINEALVTFAGLAHDIGHPPFGHNGERALNEQMHELGGFEGNAQTLRILLRLQKKETGDFPTRSWIPEIFSNDREDQRAGLNVTARAVTSVLKYDRVITETGETPEDGPRDKFKPEKGYYESEQSLIRLMKEKVVGAPHPTPLKTIECCIMDLADDIAYSTYDFEDALKAGFCTPLSVIAIADTVKVDVAADIHKKMLVECDDVPNEPMRPEEVTSILFTLFKEIFAVEDTGEILLAAKKISNTKGEEATALAAQLSAKFGIRAYSRSHTLAEEGYLRAEFTSRLVHNCLNGIDVKINEKVPALSTAKFTPKAFKVVELLKRITRDSVVQQHRLKMTERGGREIVHTIFDALLNERHGRQLLPDDWKKVYFASNQKAHRHRVVCDFVSGMTDRFCLEYYNRIQGVNAPSFFKP